MDLLPQLSISAHIGAGTLTLIAGPLAIWFNRRDPRRHRVAGRIFYWAMTLVCATAIAGFLRHPGVVFYQFLLGISLLVWAGIFRAVRALRLMRGAAVRPYDYAVSAALLLCGLWMASQAVRYGLRGGDAVMFAILFGVFGGGALADAAGHLRKLRQAAALHPSVWLHEHAITMLGAFTASTTAFTVNAAHFLPWYLQWFGPLMLILPLQLYWGRKLRQTVPAAA
ncbi:MAG: hypothetical protein NW241_09140 [Bacteroidia bacterium]|nr:hypothetical protein [Bacteroidia bacterium]